MNDDVVDARMQHAQRRRSKSGLAAEVDRLHHRSFAANGTENDDAEIQLEPENPTCFGEAACQGTVAGTLPVGVEPPLTKKYPVC